MIVDVEVPMQGLTVTEATLVRWLRQPGDAVERGSGLFEIETDKAVTEVEAPASGVLLDRLAAEGDTVQLGSVVGHIGTEAGDRAAAPDAPIPAEPLAPAAASAAALAPSASPDRPAGQRLVVSPRARRAAERLGVDLSTVQPSGGRGRHIRECDVIAAAQALPPAQTSAPAPTTAPAPAAVTLPRIRQITAERTAASFRDTPHFYLTREVSAERLVDLRQELVADGAALEGPRITITDLLVRAVALTIRAYPDFNAQWRDGSIVPLASIDIALAIDTSGGLLVPVIREADTLSLAGIAARRADLVERARTGQSRAADLSGGSFTVSNLGQLDVDQFDAIINPPQSGILAVGAIKRRPFVVDDNLVACRTLFMTLSVDHRVVDGAAAARFLQRLALLVERPVLICAQ